GVGLEAAVGGQRRVVAVGGQAAPTQQAEAGASRGGGPTSGRGAAACSVKRWQQRIDWTKGVGGIAARRRVPEVVTTRRRGRRRLGGRGRRGGDAPRGGFGGCRESRAQVGAVLHECSPLLFQSPPP